MRRDWLIFTTILISLFTFFTPSVTAQEDIQEAIIKADEVIDRDYLTAGEDVKIYGTINGDLYVAGGNVTLDGTINGDLLIAGGNVSIEGTVSQDVRAAGGQIMISGEIDRNLTVMGGNIRLSENGQIGGSIVGAGGNLVLKGPVGGDVYLGTGNLEIDNQIDGNVQAWVGRLGVSPQSVITGDLTYWSSQEASIQEGAEITGKVTQKEPKVSGLKEEDVEKFTQQFGKQAPKIRAGFTLFKFISSLIIGLLLVKLYPNFVKRGMKQLQENPWASLGIGFAFLFLTPIVLILVMITLIGLPLAAVLGFIYGLSIYLAKFLIVLWGGNWLLKKIGNQPSPSWSMVIGLALFHLLILIPLVSFWVKLFTMLFGLGVLVNTCRQTYTLARKEKIY
jgi:cytoskeletal protein CcmA (bactofilin family)